MTCFDRICDSGRDIHLGGCVWKWFPESQCNSPWDQITSCCFSGFSVPKIFQSSAYSQVWLFPTPPHHHFLQRIMTLIFVVISIFTQSSIHRAGRLLLILRLLTLTTWLQIEEQCWPTRKESRVDPAKSSFWTNSWHGRPPAADRGALEIFNCSEDWEMITIMLTNEL